MSGVFGQGSAQDNDRLFQADRVALALSQHGQRRTKIVLSLSPNQRHPFAKLFFQSFPISSNRLFQFRRAGHTFPNTQQYSPEIGLDFRPFEWNAIAGLFFQCLTKGKRRFL